MIMYVKSAREVTKVDKTIKITVKGGMVESVEGLPPGYDYKVDDKDENQHG